MISVKEKVIMKNQVRFNIRQHFFKDKKRFFYLTVSFLTITMALAQNLTISKAASNNESTSQTNTTATDTSSDVDKLEYSTVKDSENNLSIHIDGVKAGTSLGSSLTIPDQINGIKVTVISPSAFKDMKLKSVTLPNTLETIHSMAFSDNDLTTITFPASLISIGEYAFSNNQLTSVNLPHNLQTLDQYAFKNNQITGTVTIPESVDQIQRGAFQYNHIIGLNLPEKIETTSTAEITRLDMYFGQQSFDHNDLKSVRIPDGTRGILDGAFSNNPNLNSVSFPNTLTNIGEDAFQNDGLTSLDFSSVSQLQWIYAGAFQNNQLTNVKFNDKLKNIYSGAFAKNRIQSVSFPDSVMLISNSAFDTNQINSLTLPNNPATEVGSGAFANNQLTKVEIPNNLKTINSAAFYNNHIATLTGLKKSQLYLRDNVADAILVKNTIQTQVTGKKQSNGDIEVPISDILHYTGNDLISFDASNVSGATFDKDRQVFIMKPGSTELKFDFTSTIGDLQWANDYGIPAPNQVTALVKAPDPTPNPNHDSQSTPKSESTSEPQPNKPADNSNQSMPRVVAKKKSAIYALQKIYLYRGKNFHKADRIASYAKKPRINRPMFVVIDHATSKNGKH